MSMIQKSNFYFGIHQEYFSWSKFDFKFNKSKNDSWKKEKDTKSSKSSSKGIIWPKKVVRHMWNVLYPRWKKSVFWRFSCFINLHKILNLPSMIHHYSKFQNVKLQSFFTFSGKSFFIWSLETKIVHKICLSKKIKFTTRLGGSWRFWHTPFLSFLGDMMKKKWNKIVYLRVNRMWFWTKTPRRYWIV